MKLFGLSIQNKEYKSVVCTTMLTRNLETQDNNTIKENESMSSHFQFQKIKVLLKK